MTTTNQSEPGTQKKAPVQKLEAPLVPPLHVPHYSILTDPHSSYHTLAHILRTNIFPGAPVTWSSLVKDSYVCHPAPSLPPDPQHWFGRRTDDMGRWAERNILNQKLQKALRKMDQRSTPK